MGKKIEHQIIDGVENKWCGRCKKWKPLSWFCRDSSKSDGLAKRCRECRVEVHRARRLRQNTIQVFCACGCGEVICIRDGESIENRFVRGHSSRVKPPHQRVYTIVDGIKGRVCPDCEEWKSLSQFGVDNSKKDGQSWHCLDCSRKSTKAWQRENPEHRREYEKTRRAENPQITRKKNLLYRLRHPEKVAKGMLEWQRNNREKTREYNRKSHSKNAAAINAKQRERYASDPEVRAAMSIGQLIRLSRKKGAGGSFTQKEWNWLFDLCGRCCLVCGTTDNIEKDHIVPVSREGTSYIENMQPLCETHNRQKYNKIIDYRPQWLIDNFAELKAQAGL